MLHVTLRGLQGHVLRLLLTACAVMLGVSFVTGTFVLRDSIDNTLGGLVAQSSKGLDVSVRGATTEAVSPVSVDGSTVARRGAAGTRRDCRGCARGRAGDAEPAGHRHPRGQ